MNSNDIDPKASRNRRRPLTKVAIAGGVIVAAGLTAFGTTAAMAAGTASPTPSSSASAPAGAPKGGAHSQRGGFGGLRGGGFGGRTIESVSSTSLKLDAVGGTSKTYTLTDATTVALAGLRSGQTTSIDALSDLAVGQRVQVTTASSSSTTATKVTVEESHLDGTVLSVSGSSFTLRDHDGFTRSVTLASDAVVTKQGASSTAAAIVVGQQVQASGLVASDGTTLTAESANVGAPTVRPGGFGHGGPGMPGRRMHDTVPTPPAS